MRRTPRSSLLLDWEGSVTATMAITGDTLAISELDFSHSLSSIHLLDLKGNLPRTRIVVADFPVTVHSIDLNEDLLVFLKASQDQYGLWDVNIYWRRDRSKICEFNPQAGCKITSIKLLGGFLVSTSADGCIALTSLHNPRQPRNTLELAGAEAGPVLDLGVSQARIVALSDDSTVRVWKTDSENCISTLSAGNQNMSKMSVSWPLCLIAGLHVVELWNLEEQQCLQTLEMPDCRAANVLNLTTDLILVGDLKGSITLWSLPDLLDGHKARPGKTVRSLECLEEDSAVVGVSSLSPGQILVAGWSGKCSLLRFV